MVLNTEADQTQDVAQGLLGSRLSHWYFRKVTQVTVATLRGGSFSFSFNAFIVVDVAC